MGNGGGLQSRYHTNVSLCGNSNPRYCLPLIERMFDCVDAGRQPDVSFAYFGTPRFASFTSSIDLRMFFFQVPFNLSGLARSRVFRASSN